MKQIRRIVSRDAKNVATAVDHRHTSGKPFFPSRLAMADDSIAQVGSSSSSTSVQGDSSRLDLRFSRQKAEKRYVLIDFATFHVSWSHPA